MTPDFFHQNHRKGCKRDYLDARGHFVLRFGAIGDKPLGGGNYPISKTRVMDLLTDVIMVLIFCDVFLSARMNLHSKLKVVSKISAW